MSAPAVAAAYGFRVTGIAPTPLLALRGAEDWPQLHLRRGGEHAPDPKAPVLNAEQAAITLPDGHLVLDRVSATATICPARPLPDADVVHPCLWPAAAVHARWRGLETLHAGAFALPGDGGAWVVMAASGGGKSSLLTSLALAGCEVLADDLVVVDGHDCLAGPRCIDLEPDAAVALGLGERVTPVRAGERRRLELAPCDGRRPLRGFVTLAWGDRPSVERRLPSACFAMLARHRRVAVLGADLGALLELAGLPMLALRRPRDWTALEEARERLIRTAGQPS